MSSQAKTEDALNLLTTILFPEGEENERRTDLGHPLGAQLLEVHRLLSEAVSREHE